MITTDELKVQLAEHAKAVKDLEEALAIEASRKRVQELEHTMSRPGFYDDAVYSPRGYEPYRTLYPFGWRHEIFAAYHPVEGVPVRCICYGRDSDRHEDGQHRQYGRTYTFPILPKTWQEPHLLLPTSYR